jgi:hypothetical protein
MATKAKVQLVILPDAEPNLDSISDLLGLHQYEKDSEKMTVAFNLAKSSDFESFKAMIFGYAEKRGLELLIRGQYGAGVKDPKALDEVLKRWHTFFVKWAHLFEADVHFTRYIVGQHEGYVLQTSFERFQNFGFEEAVDISPVEEAI